MAHRNSAGYSLVSLCVLRDEAGGSHSCVVQTTFVSPPLLASLRSFRLRRHSFRFSRRFARSACGATRSAPLGHLRLYFDNLLSNVEHISREIRAERSDWRRRRNERSDASLGTERKHGETKWSRIVATFMMSL